MSERPERRAAEAHTNLNTYAAVIAILEGGCLYGDNAETIIQLCKRKQQKWLRVYDKAMADVRLQPKGESRE